MATVDAHTLNLAFAHGGRFSGQKGHASAGSTALSQRMNGRGGYLATIEKSSVGGPAIIYRMRAYDSTLTQVVYWNATTVDSAGASYGGPGPLVDVVLSAKLRP